MTYLQFLAIFLIVPLAVVLLIWRRDLRRWPWAVLGGLSVVALLYTGPWDNALIANGVWSIARDRVVGPAIGLVPLEEYTFYVLQVVLTGLVTTLLLTRFGGEGGG
jgi:lycopene cyclase domain-containing protein